MILAKISLPGVFCSFRELLARRVLLTFLKVRRFSYNSPWAIALRVALKVNGIGNPFAEQNVSSQRPAWTSKASSEFGGVVPRPNHSWLALITFCATTALVAALGLAILIASATVAFAIAQSLRLPSSHTSQQPAVERSFSGVVTDSRCGARHARNSGKSPAECARACIRDGMQYTLVDGEKVYALHGQMADLDSLAGQRTTVVGILDGSSIQVSSIAAQ
jgi:hypothetical protein